MAKLNWDANGERIYEAGVDRGVYYPSVGPGVAWSGLISVTEAPAGTETDMKYIDGSPYRNQKLGESYSAVVEAFTYPEELDDHPTFGMSYRTLIGNDLEGTSHGYEIHLVYNAQAFSDSKDYESLDDDLEATIFTWNLTTLPVQVPNFNASAHIVIDTRRTHSWVIPQLEDILYGVNDDPRLPSISEVIELFDVNSIIRIVDNGDGTWTATGPDEFVHLTDATSFEIISPNVTYLDNDTFKITSY